MTAKRSLSCKAGSPKIIILCSFGRVQNFLYEILNHQQLLIKKEVGS